MEDVDGGSLAARVDALYETCDVARGEDVPGASRGSLVYGEITTPARLFASLDLRSDDNFYDLGSGRGQIVLAAALSTVTPHSSVGIEFQSNRHSCAAAALKKCKDEACKTVLFEKADALQYDLKNATKIYLCNMTFEDALNSQFATALNASRAPQLQRVAMLRPLSEDAVAAAQLQLTELSTVAATWSPSGTPLYIYTRAPRDTTPGARQVVVADKEALDSMVSRRRDAAVRAHAEGLSTEGEMERGLLRTAMINAAMAQAMQTGSVQQ